MQAFSAAHHNQHSKNFSQHDDFTGWPWRQGQTGNQPNIEKCNMAKILVALKASCTIPQKMHAQAVLAERGLIGSKYPRTMKDVPECIREFFELV